MEKPIDILISTLPKNRIFGKEIGFIIECGKTIFRHSAIVDENVEFGDNDIKKIVSFWNEISPSKEECLLLGNNWYDLEGSLQHFTMASQIGKRLTEVILGNHPQLTTEVSPAQMQVVGFLHDLGRCKTHQFYATDSLTKLLMDEMGVSSKIKKNLHKIQWYWDVDKPLIIKNISLVQLISVLADTLSKVSNSQRRLRRPDELIESVKRSKQKYLELAVETDLDRLVRERIVEYGKREESVLTHALQNMKDLNVNIEEILETLDWMVDYSGEDLINKF